MSEINLHQPPTQEFTHYESLIEHSFNRAAAEGFDLQGALKAGYGIGEYDKVADERIGQIVATAASLAVDLQLEPTFFDQTAHTVLLAGIAESWLSSEETKSRGGYDSKLADERAMLVDVAMMIAGEDSGAVKALARVKPAEAKRYVSVEGQDDHKEIERVAFFESINDPKLAERVKDVFSREGTDSLLSQQRAMLGLTEGTEEAFDVKVLSIGNIYELRQVGFLPPIEWPDWNKKDTSRDELLAASKVASDEAARQEAAAQPYIDAADECKRRFGDLPIAFVRREDGKKPTMYLQAPTALGILKLDEQHNGYEVSHDSYLLRDAKATAQHEYAHTQKNLALGTHQQLGLILEERKAELVSHDKMGYNDIKYLFNDLSMVHDTLLLEKLEASLQHADPLSCLLVDLANTIGLRNSLLLMASKPSPYDREPDASERFPHNHSIVREGDASPHDAMISESIKHKGTEALQVRAAAFAGKILLERGEDGLKFVVESYLPYKERHGVVRANKFIANAVDNVLQSQERTSD